MPENPRYTIRMEAIKTTFEALPAKEQETLKALSARFRAQITPRGRKPPHLGLWGFLELVFALHLAGAFDESGPSGKESS